MKVAIVGTSVKLTPDEHRVMRQEIAIVLKHYPLDDTVIISGGAKGVDTLSLQVAKDLGFKTKEYKPEKNEWEYYKKRNLQLAEDCDDLYCFSIRISKTKCYHHDPPQKHEKTAGCWTSKMATNLGKSCQLIVISK